MLTLCRGKNNTASHPPEYCPPVPLCQSARLSGGTCPIPMGYFEPIVCKKGYYCPPGGRQQLVCPTGYFCPEGSVNATKCSIGANCLAGSQNNMGFLPIAVLLVVDIALIALVIAKKLQNKLKRDRGGKAMKSPLFPISTRRLRERNYHEINDSFDGFSNLDVQKQTKSNHRSRTPTGFQHLGSKASHWSVTQQSKEEGQTELYLFVESLSKCLGASKFGLTFEFQGLSFKPPKSNKFILSEVSGIIHAGSLWGVMGASGAGKCMFELYILII